MQTMYSGKVNSPATTLDGGINNVVTTINIIDGSVLPNAPNLAVIGTGEDAETILYATKVVNQLSNITRGFQGIAKEWSTGEAIARLFTEYDYSALKSNIEALPNDFIDLNDTPANYAGSSLKSVRVNVGENDLEFVPSPAGSVFTVSGAEAFNGTSPTSWTDLNLSAIVGSNSAMVLLSIIQSSANVDCAIRRNGDTTEYYHSASYGIGAAAGRSWNGMALVLLCITDTSGVIEWKSSSATAGTIVTVIAYIK